MRIMMHAALAALLCLCEGGQPAAGEQAPANERARLASVPAPAGGEHTAASKAAATFQLDDGSAEESIGIVGGGQYMWFNRFTPAPDAFPLQVESVDMVYGGNGVVIGHEVEIFLYQDTDADGDPATGTELVARMAGTVQAANWVTPSTYVLDPAPVFEGPGDIIVAVVNRSGALGMQDYPAALDQTTSQGRSFFATWNSPEVPETPTLPAPTQHTIDEEGFPGNWMLRASVETNIPDTRPPLLLTNGVLTVAEGASAALGPALLHAEDPDTNDDLLEYALTSGPAHGQLELASDPGVAIATFTQAELDAGQVLYRHDGSNTTSDGFTFTIEDTGGNILSGQTFAITVTAVADDAVVVSPTTVVLTEGSTDTATIVLSSEPTGTVIVDLGTNDASVATAAPLQLSFSPANWSVPQSVTVQAVDDSLVGGTRSTSITVSVGAATEDSAYAALPASTIAVTTLDNDVAGLSLAGAGDLTTDEDGGSDSFTVVLDSQPMADVIVSLASSDPTEGTVSPSQLLFTAANWNVPQAVTVSGVDDLSADGAGTWSVLVTVASDDPLYDGLPVPSAGVVNGDDEGAALLQPAMIPATSTLALALLGLCMLVLGAALANRRGA